MKRILMALFYLLLLTISLVQVSEALPKVTQAAFCSFKTNQVTVLSVEEFQKPLKLLFLGPKNKVVYSTTFSEVLNNDKFAYTNPFLRFRIYKLKGLPSPVIVAVAVSPGGTDFGYQIKIIGEKNGAITTLTHDSIDLTIQDGFYLGHINTKYGNGMIIWKNIWGENESHYEPHRYQLQIYKWDSRGTSFQLIESFDTKNKFKHGCSALRAYQLPCKNFRDEIVPVEQDVSTLGIEDELIPRGEKNEKHP